jgi:hypothetical protein
LGKRGEYSRTKERLLARLDNGAAVARERNMLLLFQILKKKVIPGRVGMRGLRNSTGASA